MIVSFYDKNFKGLQNNASLVVDKDSYSLIKRPIEMNTLSCTCEPFTENIQPTFLVIKDNLGNKIYSSLAGIPLLNSDNKTEINGTDLKSMLSSDVILQPTTYTLVKDYIQYVFDQWKSQVNQNTLSVELTYKNYGTEETPDYAGNQAIGDLAPSEDKAVYNAFDEIQAYLKYYNLYLDSDIDLVNKKVVFTLGRVMVKEMNIKLWEYGIKNYGKFVADVNECQGYYNNGTSWTAGFKWIMTSSGAITTTETNRDIYPIKRRVFVSEEDLTDANTQALTELLNNLYNEDITLNAVDRAPNFETMFKIYVNKGDETPYKTLPCGELHYNTAGLSKFQIGYRFTGAEFI